MKLLLFFASVILLCTACGQNTNRARTKHVFVDTPVVVPISSGVIDEASGIADSRANPGYLWVEQDSGNPPEISLLAYSGAVVKKIYISNAHNRDWEELALAEGPEQHSYYIYLADIGDNFLQYENYCLYRFKEPSVSTDTVSAYDKIIFIYPDGSNNAEAILVDNNTKDIYLITKSDIKTNIYKLAYPQSISGINTAELVGSLAFTGVVGACISPNGKEIIIKTYTTLNYWARERSEKIEQTLKRPASLLAYQLEIQGEAVCFKNNNTGFYTLSEKPPLVGNVDLNFYKRK